MTYIGALRSVKHLFTQWWRRQMETFSALLAFLRGIHRSPVNSPHKGQWGGALKFSLICAWTNSWANNGDAGDLRRHRAHYDVIVMRHPAQEHLWKVGNWPQWVGSKRDIYSQLRDIFHLFRYISNSVRDTSNSIRDISNSILDISISLRDIFIIAIKDISDKINNI